MDIEEGLNQNDLIEVPPYIPTIYNPPEQSLITSVLERKATSIRSILVDVLSQIQSTSILEKILLSYLDFNINKVENHLLQIDFWQNHNLHQDVMTLRSQMQQHLFQLEQEKVRTRIQLHGHLITLSKEARIIQKELNDIELNARFFSQDYGRIL